MIEKIQPRIDLDFQLVKKINEIVDDTNINSDILTKHSQQLNRIESELKEIRKLLTMKMYAH